MSQLITVLLTVVSGVLVFVVGQIVLECYIKPLQEYHKIKSEIGFLLLYYANVFMNPIDIDRWGSLSEWEDKNYSEASNKLREAAAKLEGFKQQKVFFIKKSRIEEAEKGLIGLSNSLFYSDDYKQLNHNQQLDENIRRELHLR